MVVVAYRFLARVAGNLLPTLASVWWKEERKRDSDTLTMPVPRVTSACNLTFFCTTRAVLAICSELKNSPGMSTSRMPQ